MLGTKQQIMLMVKKTAVCHFQSSVDPREFSFFFEQSYDELKVSRRDLLTIPIAQKNKISRSSTWTDPIALGRYPNPSSHEGKVDPTLGQQPCST